MLPEILAGILEIQENGFNLSIEQLQKLKPLIDSYDENIQEMAINLFSSSIIKNNNLIKSEIKFIISRMNDFEPLVRETFINILIETFFESLEHQKDILEGLINSLKDEIWTIRIKIIEFLNKIALEMPDALRKFDKELEVLYEEKDVDVIREVLDFLLRLFIETYTVEDIKNLIKSIPNRDWPAQEKILFLIGKLGIKKKEQIEPIKKDLLYLLDYDDYLVNNVMVNIIKEIIEYHPALFDDILFPLIKNEELDNLEAIEDILRHSIIKHGFKRFYGVFKNISLLDEQIFNILNSVIQKMYDEDLKLMKSIFFQLLTYILDNHLNQFNYLKLRMILFPNPHYDIYSTCYKILNSKGPLEDDNEEYRRDKLIKLLHEIMPELGYMTMSVWLDLQLKQGQVKLKELCDKFHLTKSKLMEILKILLKSKMLKAVINNDIIEPIKVISDLEHDLLFLKKWKITRCLKTFDYEIQLLVKIKNTSKVQISDFSIIIDYPQNLFIKPESNDNDKYIPQKLKPNQDFTLTWKFHKDHKEGIYPLTSNMKIVIIYQKEEIIYSKVKKLDILLLI